MNLLHSFCQWKWIHRLRRKLMLLTLYVVILLLLSRLTINAMEARQMTLEDDFDNEFSPTNFTSSSQLYAKVGDSKSDVWVVQVVTDTSNSEMIPSEWKEFTRGASKVGIRTGYFDCSTERGFCNKNGWWRSQLVLALPFYRRNGLLKTYITASSLKADKVMKWISSNLKIKVSTINSMDQLRRNWFYFDERRLNVEYVRVILLSNTVASPLSFYVLSSKFSGKISFGMVDQHTNHGKNLMKEMNLRPGSETYLILTPELNYTYGYTKGQSMVLLLRSLVSDINDVFWIILYIINLACILEFFLNTENMFDRIIRVVVAAVIWNVLHVMMWIPITKLTELTILSSHLTSLFRRICLTSFAASVRSDVLYFSTSQGFIVLLATFFVFTTCIGIALSYFDFANNTLDNARNSAAPFFENINHSRITNHERAYNNDSNRQRRSHSQNAAFRILEDDVFVNSFPNDSAAIADILSIEYSEYWKDNLRIWRYGSSSQEEEEMIVEEQCVICFENFKKSEELCSLLCAHVFHLKCIREWFIKNRANQTCPVCRGEAFESLNNH